MRNWHYRERSGATRAAAHGQIKIQGTELSHCVLVQACHILDVQTVIVLCTQRLSTKTPLIVWSIEILGKEGEG